MTNMRREGANVVSQLKAGNTVALTHNGVVLAHIVPVQHTDGTGLTPQHLQDMALGAGNSYEALKAIAEHAAASAVLLKKLVRDLRPEPEAVDIQDLAEPGEPEYLEGITAAEASERLVKFVEVMSVPDILMPLTEKQKLELDHFYGLHNGPDGWSLTGAGMERAISECRRTARTDPDSPEAAALGLDDDNPDKFAFLVSVQLDKRAKALERRARGDRDWCPGVS